MNHAPSDEENSNQHSLDGSQAPLTPHNKADLADTWDAGSTGSGSTPTDIDPYGDQPTPAAEPLNTWSDPASHPGSSQANQSNQPMSSSTQPRQAIDALRVRRSKGPIIFISAIAAAIVVTLIIFAVRPAQPAPPTSATPAPTQVAPTPTVFPTAVGVQSSIPIVVGTTFNGNWTIDSAKWDDSGLTLNVTLSSTNGALAFSFLAIDNGGSTSQYHASGQLSNGTISSGRTVSGTISFAKPRGDTTVILLGAGGQPITALSVAG